MGEDVKAEDVLVRLDPSQPRRIIAVAVLVGLAVLMISVGVRLPREQMALRLLMLGLGVLAFYSGFVTWQATATGLVLTQSGMYDGGGRLLAEMANMRDVSRGAFAMKPSHGFSLRLHKGMGFAWAPGLWWRIGRQVGVGGVTPAQPARQMAEMITAIIAGRDQ